MLGCDLRSETAVKWKRVSNYSIRSGEFYVSKFITSKGERFGAYRNKECLGFYGTADEARERCNESKRTGVSAFCSDS